MSISISMLLCSLLLINLSFKMIQISGFVFSASALLCPLMIYIYLQALRDCTVREQRHILNMTLLGLYLFSIGLYLLLHLPGAAYMNQNAVYSVVFEDIPRKFFSLTFAFGVSFYLPHLFLNQNIEIWNRLSLRAALLQSFTGGIFFFLIHFVFLFSEPNIQQFNTIFYHSFLTCLGLMLFVALSCLFQPSFYEESSQDDELMDKAPVYQYLVALTVMIMLICVSCNYLLVNIWSGWTFTASSLLFPLALMIGTVITELYGFRAMFKAVVVLALSQLSFDCLLMLAAAIPSPDFFNLNAYYQAVIPGRIPAEILSMAVIFLSNGYLLQRLAAVSWLKKRGLRIFVANFCTTIIILVSYELLLVKNYDHMQLLQLAVNAWLYKNSLTLITLPSTLWLCQWLQKRLQNKSNWASVRIVD